MCGHEFPRQLRALVWPRRVQSYFRVEPEYAAVHEASATMKSSVCWEEAGDNYNTKQLTSLTKVHCLEYYNRTDGIF